MPKLADTTGEPNLSHNPGRDRADIDTLIEKLRSHDGLTRQRARKSLVAIGSRSVASLLKLLVDPRDQVRWEAAKALSDIGDPMAASALVAALEDESFGVRWLAADGLIALERDALPPLLEALKEDGGSLWLREGAHHVLRMLAAEHDLDDQVTLVLTALESIEPDTDVPLAAQKALQTL
jgi:HEAT repeat protein